MPTTSSSGKARSKNGTDTNTATNLRSVPASTSTRPTPEQIAQRAYEIYEREGSQPGNDLENWLRAEAELSGRSH